MAIDWRSFCTNDRFVVDDDEVVVAFDDGRRQRVRVSETDDTYELQTVVARRAVVASIGDLPLRVWSRNRVAQLVGFRVDARGRVCGAGWVPKAGLTAEEFLLVLFRVTAEADRFEFILTGRDVE